MAVMPNDRGCSRVASRRLHAGTFLASPRASFQETGYTAEHDALGPGLRDAPLGHGKRRPLSGAFDGAIIRHDGRGRPVEGHRQNVEG